MQVEVLLGALALCAVLFSSSNGTSTDNSIEDTRLESSQTNKLRYTRQEDEFIIAQLETLPGVISLSDWDNIALAHKRKRISKSKGFKKHRSPVSLRHRFLRFMMKGKGLVQVPESIKRKVSDSRFTYHSEEHKLINEKLLSYIGTSLYNFAIWRQIKKEHDIRRESKATGFKHKRTMKALLNHFHNYMKPRGLVTPDVIRSFPSSFTDNPSCSERSPKSQEQSACSQDTVQNIEGNQDTVLHDEGNSHMDLQDDGNSDRLKTEGNWATPLLEAMELLSETSYEESEPEDLSDSDEEWLPVRPTIKQNKHKRKHKDLDKEDSADI